MHPIIFQYANEYKKYKGYKRYEEYKRYEGYKSYEGYDRYHCDVKIDFIRSVPFVNFFYL